MSLRIYLTKAYAEAIFMVCSLDELRRKEVIDINSGERLGFIDDVRLDLETSGVVGLVIYGRTRFFGIFGRDEDVEIPCGDIRVVGSEVVLISRSLKHEPSISTDNKRITMSGLFK